MPTQNLPECAKTFVSHRPPILMLRQLTSCDAESAEGIASIPVNSPFLNTGLLPRSFFVEILSQLIAAAQGYREFDAGVSAGGYLVGVHEFECCKDALGGDCLDLHIRTINQVEGLYIIEGKVTRGDQPLASGEISCFRVSSSELQQRKAVVTHNMEWNHQRSLREVIQSCMDVVSLNVSSGKAEANFVFMPNAPVFGGHFPGKPIVPGVIWAEAALTLAAALLSRQMILRKIVSARFKKPIGPHDKVRLELNIRSETSGFLLNSEVRAGKGMAASCELLVEPI